MKRVRNVQVPLFILFILSLLLIISSLPALAHRVMIFGWVEGDTVFTESKFSGGKKATNAQVLVFDRDGKQLLEGRTNGRGEFSFKVPRITELRIVLNASMGHKAEWRIPESEIRAVTGLSEIGNNDERSQPVAPGLSREEVRKLVEDSLDRKLAPIVNMLTELRSQGPSVTEIVGGIGYIVGLMGLALYFMSRERQRPKENKDG